MLLNYKKIGQGHPFILIHGLFGSLDNLGNVARTLSEHFSVINIDMPDHGDSFRSQHFSYASYANAVVELMDALNIEQAHVLGHSMGGKVAMQMALDAPNRISKLILADIAPVAYHSRHDAVFNALNSVDLAHLSSRSQAMKTMMTHLEEPGVAQFLLKSLTEENGAWRWKFNLTFLQENYPLILQAIEATTPFDGPTFFIKGALSDYLLAEHQPVIQALFPNSKAKIISGTGHWLHAEKPIIFNKIVSDFALD